MNMDVSTFYITHLFYALHPLLSMPIGSCIYDLFYHPKVNLYTFIPIRFFQSRSDNSECEYHLQMKFVIQIGLSCYKIVYHNHTSYWKNHCPSYDHSWFPIWILENYNIVIVVFYWVVSYQHNVNLSPENLDELCNVIDDL